MKKKIRMLSPDGFDMFNGKTYNSEKKAWNDFQIWKKRFEDQGYYSSNKKRISLEELQDYMQIV